MVAKRCAMVVLVLAASIAVWSLEACAVPLAEHMRLRDVSLHEGGVLRGQLLNPQGTAIVGEVVAISKAGQPVTKTRTDKDGRFRVAGLSGGVYQVSFAQQATVCRVWAPSTAPPAAQQGLMLVRSTDVVRGQCGCGTPVCGSGCGSGGVYGRGAAGGGLSGWMANHPVLTAGGIAAAIAVPLAIDDDAAATP